MILTGKCKEDFEKWYLQWVFNEKTFLSLNFKSEQILENWNSLHHSEKYGVLVDFFNSVGYHISNISSPEDVAQGVAEGNIYFFCILTRIGKIDFETGFYKYRKESLIKVVKQSNYFYNNS
ncbi:hypothetical protein F7649_10675 [Tenacibaculum piscium]|uniref:hypothetical protein n=1 Tax=Tenacibaculum piscium TaxID=1458515 RepID=UPI00187B5349|nr:hypothetical protein [Tenacibaculum piscium]MBE7671576.1 hypothetical protein [Tenacibaculum piscium]